MTGGNEWVNLDDEKVRGLFYLAGKDVCYKSDNRVAGSLSEGYRRVSIQGKSTGAHRVAWFLHYGKWPDGFIDHINHDRSDNRIGNLRLVSRSDNARNQKLHSHNVSGFNGVSYHKKRQEWRAVIQVDGKKKWVGAFKTKGEAIAARQIANMVYGFHENHGEVSQ